MRQVGCPWGAILRGSRFFVASVLASGALLEGAGAETRLPVIPSQDFSTSLLQVHAPASQGWFLVSHSGSAIAFAKSGRDTGESLAATVMLFTLPALPDADAFTAYVRQAVQQDSPPDRFEVLESTFQYTSGRGYPCVKAHAVANDRKARVSAFSTRTLRVEMISLYCQHPSRTGMGFSVTFSHRGGVADEGLEAQAQGFINAVQATPQTPAPSQFRAELETEHHADP